MITSLYRIDNLIEFLKKVKEEYNHNMIAMDLDLEFVKGFSNGEVFLTELDEIPSEEKENFKPVLCITEPSKIS